LSKLSACLAACFALSFLVYAADSGWTVAAEKFSLVDVPPIYENLAEIVPQLMLSRLGTAGDRTIVPGEQVARQLQTLSADRVKLVRERAELVLARDRVFFAPESSLRRALDRNAASDKVRAKEKAIADVDAKIAKLLDRVRDEKEVELKVSLWKSGTLFSRGEGKALADDLAANGVSGLITGQLEDVAGYLYVSVSLDTGIAGIPIVTVTDAAPYDELDDLVSSLIARLLPEIIRRPTVRLEIVAEPADANVFVDGRLVTDNAKGLVVFAGKHELVVSASGYETARKTADLQRSEAFALRIKLKPVETMDVTITTDVPADLYINSAEAGTTPAVLNLPRIKTIGELTDGDVHTWFVLDPEAVIHGARQGDPGTFAVRTNKEQTESLIEKRRDLLYWGLAGLYISLPVSMVSLGMYNDLYYAYEADRPVSVSDMNTWLLVSRITTGVSIGLAVNFGYQLFRYLVAADQTMPREGTPVPVEEEN
jgi:hypothetical protein